MSELIVLRVKIKGETKYISGIPSQLNPRALVNDYIKATNFSSTDHKKDGNLREILGWINVPGTCLIAKSGIWVDEEPEVVRYKISYTEEEVVPVKLLASAPEPIPVRLAKVV